MDKLETRRTTHSNTLDAKQTHCIHLATLHCRPKPVAFFSAIDSFFCSFSLLEYSGRSSTEKHVLAVGNCEATKRIPQRTRGITIP